MDRDGSHILDTLRLEDGGFRLATDHCQENVDTPARLRVIINALRTLAKDAPIVLPIHPHPRNMLAQENRLEEVTKGIRAIVPNGFEDMIAFWPRSRAAYKWKRISTVHLR